SRSLRLDLDFLPVRLSEEIVLDSSCSGGISFGVEKRYVSFCFVYTLETDGSRVAVEVSELVLLVRKFSADDAFGDRAVGAVLVLFEISRLIREPAVGSRIPERAVDLRIRCDLHEPVDVRGRVCGADAARVGGGARGLDDRVRAAVGEHGGGARESDDGL